MGVTRVAVTINSDLIAQVDRLVAKKVFANRSQAIQEALREKLARLKKTRLAYECRKLDRCEEQSLAEEGMNSEWYSWPEY
jgi:metal-responsive CopG/Arc/MetJ family transcriptional regulator